LESIARQFEDTPLGALATARLDELKKALSLASPPQPAVTANPTMSREAQDFRVCNATPSRIGIALGYKEHSNWKTEGWWNLAARSCETLVRGKLSNRFWYMYAVDYDRGGDWSGRHKLCTRDKEFTILDNSGGADCLARGFSHTGFFEVDTGDSAGWTVNLTDAASAKPAGARP
jgi:uncharacterized membrane protein